MRHLVIMVIFFVFIFSNSFAQKIEIGEDAENVRGLIEWLTNDHNRGDSYGNRENSIWSWDVKYYDGRITEVIQCFQNQYIINYHITVDYCKHYIMEKGVLAYLLTQYENISLESLKSIYEKVHPDNKIGELYFTDDYKYYANLYLAKNGRATVRTKKTIFSELSKETQQIIKKRSLISNKVDNNPGINYEENIVQRNFDAAKKIIKEREGPEEVGSTLRAFNFTIKGVIEQNDVKENNIDSKKIRILQISFDIEENRSTVTGSKKIYFTLLGPDKKPMTGSPLDSSKFTTRDGIERYFTKKFQVDHKQGEKETITLEWKLSNEFQPGDYKFEVYNNGFKIGEGFRNLKE